MSKALKTVALIAGVVALAASAVVTGGATLGIAATVIATAHTVLTIASIVALAAGLAAQALTKPPPVQGSATQVTVGSNQLMPYGIGRSLIAGAIILDVAYGPTVDGVPNPYSSTALAWSLGPIESFEAFQCDFTTIPMSGGTSGAASGYYGGFMHLATQKGLCPEPAALAGPWGAIPGWGADAKLSGLAAGLWSNKFDRKGKVFASGLPSPGMIGRWALVYDPRQDSTYPGGDGACRPRDESTYVGGAAAENPSCHAVTYALGRFQNGVKAFGPAYEADAIDWPAFVAWANVCDANGWKVGGVLYEGPGVSRWDNLKRICAAGAAQPCHVGGLLSVRYQAPKVALDTITEDDLADGGLELAGMKTWTKRRNAIVPKYKSEEHHWEYVQSNEVRVADYVAVDGEEKSEERTYELCQWKDQAAQLAAYDIENGRELGPFVLPLKPRLSRYRPGEALNVNLPKLGLVNRLCTITGRHRDPGKFMVVLTLETETNSKHAFALGQTGTAPPTPALSTAAEKDAAAAIILERDLAVLIGNSSTQPTRVLTAADNGDGTATVTVLAHQRLYPDGVTVALEEQAFPGLLTDTAYFPYYVDLGRSQTHPTIELTTDSATAQGLLGAHSLGRIRTPIADSGVTYEGGGAYMPGATVGREVDGPIVDLS